MKSAEVVDPNGEPVDTPALLVDLAQLDTNVARWAELLEERGVALRPHIKTSKTREVVQRQVDAGAVGLTVATLQEAELWIDAGFDNVLQAYPVWAGNPSKARRIRDLHERATYIAGVDSKEGAEKLAAAVKGSATPLPVMLEIDSGQHRTGVRPSEVGPLATYASDLGLHIAGIFTHGGHSYARPGAGAADDEVDALTDALHRLHDIGLTIAVVSAGSTPTALQSARHPVNEERPGTYVFGDAQQIRLGAISPDEVSLFVATTVVASHPDRFVLDAGSKILGADRPSWLTSHGIIVEYPDATIVSVSEHHAVVHSDGPKPRVGDVVSVIPNHACISVNLEDELLAVDGNVIVDRWAIEARGKNR